jgi:glycogen(starch) synthase
MRLLMTTDTVGGVWTYTTSIIPELLAKGVAVALVSIGREPLPAQIAWLKQMAQCWGEAFRWEGCEAPLEWMESNQWAYASAEPLLLRVADEFHAELLHSNQFCFGALPLSLPRLVVAHSDVLSWASQCRAEPLCPSAWLSQYSDLVGCGLQAAHAVVAPTRWMLAALAVNYVLPPAARVIANGRTLPPAQSRPGKTLQAVTAGRLWDEAKNLLALSAVQAPVPVLLAGESQYESQTLPGMNANVSLLGRLDEAHLLDLFRESAIYICTSRYEPFGLAPLEAALCGCAVLANDIPSLREVWGTGALYFHDATSLSASLTLLKDHPDVLADAQRRSFRRASRYTATAMADKYLQLYREMLAGSEEAACVA